MSKDKKDYKAMSMRQFVAHMLPNFNPTQAQRRMMDQIDGFRSVRHENGDEPVKLTPVRITGGVAALVIFDELSDPAVEGIIERGPNNLKLNLHDIRAGVESGLYKSDEPPFVNSQFPLDLAEAHGLTRHPKSEAVYSLAWDYGHANGLMEVAEFYGDLAALLLP